MKIWNLLGGLTLVAALGSAVAFPAYAKEAAYPDGIYVGDFSLGGLTKEQAEKGFSQYLSELEARTVTLRVDGTEVKTTAKELGYACGNEDALEEAEDYAAGGCLIRQYMERKDLEKEPVHIPLDAQVDEASVQTLIDAKCAGLVDEPKDAVITRKNGKFEITEEQTGKTVDTKATIEKLNEALAEDLAEVTADAVIIVGEPKIKKEDLASISDVLGTCTTAYASSGASRSGNIANGVSKINGHVLMPGETLSGYECMHPFTIENGYFTAAAYENGQVVDSVGGGVCQIATTLYDASLEAELEITQRQNHSMIVTYVKPSMDAAIAGTYKDIKVTNPYDTPIYIEAGTSGKTLTFTIYGKETRPANRTIQYVSETLSVTDPGETVVQDASLAPGARVRVQAGHKGIRSRLWKCVYIDGVEQEKTLLYTDTYNASKAIYHVGPAAPVPAPETTTPETTQVEPTPDQGPKGPGEIGPDSQNPAAG